MVPTAVWPGAGEASAAVSSLCWACGSVMFMRLRPQVPAAALNMGKNVVGTVCFMIALAIATGLPWPTDMAAQPLILFTVSGVLGLAISDTFLLRSMLTIGPQRASLVFCLAPVFTALAAMAPPLHEFPGALTWVGMLVCLVGIALAVGAPSAVVRSPADMRRGVRDAALAALLQASAVVLARQAFVDPSATTLGGATVRLASGTAALLIYALCTKRLGGWWRAATAGRNKVNLPAAAFIGTFLGIMFNQLGIQWSRHTGVAATLNALTPVYLLPLSAWFLGERFRLRSVVATALAVAGIALIALG